MLELQTIAFPRSTRVGENDVGRILASNRTAVTSALQGILGDRSAVNLADTVRTYGIGLTDVSYVPACRDCSPMRRAQPRP